MSGAGSASLLPTIAFTGRFQPFHCDHLEMVRHALSLAEHVVIGVTNADGARRHAHPSNAHRHLDAANPFTYAQREQLIASALQADGIVKARYRIIPFPLEEPELWPAILASGTPQLVRVFSDWEREKVRRFNACGYPAVIIAGDAMSRVAATDLRRRLSQGMSQLEAVPPGARELLASWYAPRSREANA